MYYSANTKHDIINLISRDKKLRREIEGICKTNKVDDLLQELYVILLTKNEELILGLNQREELKFYIIRIIISQFYSKTSRYYNHFKKHQDYLEFDSLLTDDFTHSLETHRSYDDYLDSLREEEANDFKTQNAKEKNLFINKHIQELDWYDRKIWDFYMTGDKISFTKLSKKLNISRNSLWNTIKKIKNNIQEDYNNG